MLENIIKKIIRVGRVKAIYPERATVRVQFDDLSGIQSSELQILMRRTQKDMDYDMFVLEEQVLCLFLPFARNRGFVIGSIYPLKKAESNSDEFKNKKIFKFEDGTEISYDRDKKTFKLHSSGDINISSDGNIEVSAQNITMTANTLTINAKTTITETLSVDKTIHAEGNIDTKSDVKTTKCTLNTHVHNHTDATCKGISTRKTTQPTG